MIHSGVTQKIYFLILIFITSYCQILAQDRIIVSNGNNIRNLFGQSDKVFIIRENIDIGHFSGTITLGSNCTIDFQGGSIKGGVLKGNRTRIVASNYSKIFDNVVIKGSWNLDGWIPQWFGAKGDGITDDTEAIKSAHKAAYNTAVDGVTSKEIGEMVVKLPIGRYYVRGDRVFGSVREDDSDYSKRSVAYTLYGDYSSIIWSPQNRSSELFLFDYTIRRERISNLKILLKDILEGSTQKTLISGKRRVLRTAGIVFRLKSEYDNGKNLISSYRNSYEDVTIAPFSYEDNVVSGPDYVFYITGSCHCDMTKVTHCSFSLFRTMYYSENDQAVNWMFDHCSHNSNIDGAVFYDCRFFNDNLIIQNSEFDILSDNSTILKLIDNGVKSSNSSPLPNVIFQSNRIETQKTPYDSDVFILDSDFGHVKIDNCNFILQGTRNTHVYRLSKDARMTIRDSELKNPKLLIPIYDGDAYLEGNEIADAIILDNVVHMGISFKIWDHLNNMEYNVSDVLSRRNLKFRNVRVSNLKEYGQPFPSLSFTIINDCLYGGKQTPIEERSAIIECNGYTTGSSFRLPAYSMITRIDLIGYKQPSKSGGIKDIIVKQGTNEWVIPVNQNTEDIINPCVFTGCIGVLNDNLVNEFSFTSSDGSLLQLRVSYCQYVNMNDSMSEKEQGGYKAFALSKQTSFRKD